MNKYIGAAALALGLAGCAGTAGVKLYDRVVDKSGDGIAFGNTITSRALGVNVVYACELNTRRTPDGDLCEDIGWCCNSRPEVQDFQYELKDLADRRRPINTREKIAAASSGFDSEILIELGLIAAGLYKLNRKQKAVPVLR